jgi:hypothetical protein
LLNRTWRSALPVTDGEGLPAIEDAGNVLRSRTVQKLALRIPPTVDGERRPRSSGSSTRTAAGARWREPVRRSGARAT